MCLIIIFLLSILTLTLSTRIYTLCPSRHSSVLDFSDLEVDAAGVARRPDETSYPADMRDLCYGLVRLLDDDYCATGPWDPRLNGDTLLDMLKAMVMTRAFDERMFRAQRQGKTSFYMK